MFLIEIAGARILYTGDYSTEDDRHLITASVPNWGRPPDVMICESTFGVQNLPMREEKEEMFLSTIANIFKRGGRVLMPVFAVGNAQELLLILDEHWKSRPDLQKFPIYFIERQYPSKSGEGRQSFRFPQERLHQGDQGHEQ